MPTFIHILLLIFFPLSIAHAQIFSVQSDDTRAADNKIGIYGGIETFSLTYQGNDPPNLNTGIYALDGQVVRVKLVVNGIHGYLGFGGAVTGLGEKKWFDAGVRTGWAFKAIDSPGAQLNLLLQLKSSILSVSEDRENSILPDFNRGTLSAGIGADTQLSVSDFIRFYGGVLTQFGFCRPFGERSELSGGHVFELETTTRIYFDQVFGTVGLTAGWDWQFKRLDVERRFYDYDLRSNSFLLGVIFVI